MKKRILTALSVTVMLLVVILTMISCGGKECKHSYSKKDVAATCTAAGKIVYTCDKCGDSYTEKGAAAIGHDLKKVEAKAATCTEAGYAAHEACSRCSHTTKVEIAATGHYYRIDSFTLPTLNNKGSKAVTCEACNESTTEEIEAMGVASPALAEIVSEIMEALSFTLETADGSSVVVTTTSSDYSKDEGEKVFYAIELCEAKLYAENNVPKGYLNIEISSSTVVLDGTKTPADVTAGTYAPFATINVYLDGDTVALDGTVDGEESKQTVSLTESLFGGMLEGTGLTSDDAVAAVYFLTELGKCLPEIEEITKELEEIELPELSESFTTNLTNTLKLFGEKLFEKTENADGTVVYETDLTAISVLIDALKGKTVAEAIDSVYGSGAANAIKDFAISLPALTVRDVAEFAIAASENFGIEVDQVFSLVDMVIYQYAGKSVSIRYELEKQYNVTIAELANQGDDFDKDQYIADAQADITDAITKLYAYDLEAILNLLVYGSEAPETEVDTSVFDTIIEYAATLNDQFSLAVTLDAEGNFVSAKLEVSTSNDGTLTVVLDPNGINFEVVVGGEIVGDAFIEKVVEADGTVKYNGDFVVGEDDFLDLEVVIKDNVTQKINFVLNFARENYNDETGSSESVIEEAINVQYNRVGTADNCTGTLSIKLGGNKVIGGTNYINGENSGFAVEILDDNGDHVVKFGVDQKGSGELAETTYNFVGYSQGFDVLVIEAVVANGEIVNAEIKVTDLVYEGSSGGTGDNGGAYSEGKETGEYKKDTVSTITYTKEGDVRTVVFENDKDLEITLELEKLENGNKFIAVGKDKDRVMLNMELEVTGEDDGTHVAIDVFVNEFSSYQAENGATLTGTLDIDVEFIVTK